MDFSGKHTLRRVYFADLGWTEVPVHRFEAMHAGKPLTGPAIIESSFTTIVVEPLTVAERTSGGGLRLTF
jgi:N-methylhydantoinase A